MIQETINDWKRQLRARYQASPLPEFMSWWGKELGDLMPAHFKQRLMPPAPSLWLVPGAEPGDLDIWQEQNGLSQVDVFKASEDASLLKNRWQGLIDGFDQGKPRVILCLSPDAILERQIDLPAAVESNLRQSIQYQIDQFTPFDPSTVYFDHRILERDQKSGRLSVDLRVLPIQSVVDWTDRLEAIGVRVHIIDRLAASEAESNSESDGHGRGEDGHFNREGFNLLPEAKRPEYVYARAQLNWRLAGLAVLALVVVMTSSVYLRERSVARLEFQVNELRAEAQAVMALQRELSDALDAANFLAQKRAERAVMVHVLDEVTRLLPARMWLQQMQVRGEEITMMGYAEGSQRLIELINNSYLFEDAAFRGRVTIDPDTDQERFTVQAVIDRRAGNAVAAAEGE
ncbi:MAG TPA: PilN domain-containing protein [Wenzhouxiangella sp.]